MRADQGPLLQDLLQQRGWWTFIQITGLLVGGLLIARNGFMPWWEVCGLFCGESTGLDLFRGRVAFSLGLFLALLGALRAANSNNLLRHASAAVGCCAAAAVVTVTFIELDQFNHVDDNILSSFRFGVRTGLYYTLIGGFIAFFGSLFGLIPERSAQ